MVGEEGHSHIELDCTVWEEASESTEYKVSEGRDQGGSRRTSSRRKERRIERKCFQDCGNIVNKAEKPWEVWGGAGGKRWGCH
jgi:hypothetical protein